MLYVRWTTWCSALLLVLPDPWYRGTAQGLSCLCTWMAIEKFLSVSCVQWKPIQMCWNLILTTGRSGQIWKLYNSKNRGIEGALMGSLRKWDFLVGRWSGCGRINENYSFSEFKFERFGAWVEATSFMHPGSWFQNKFPYLTLYFSRSLSYNEIQWGHMDFQPLSHLWL